MHTLKEIESAISQNMSRFEHEHMGRDPERVAAHLIGDLLVVRLKKVLTVSELRLVKALPGENGRSMLKQVRTQLLEAARPIMEAMVLEVTGVEVVNLHHDISTVTGEKVVLFTLASEPLYRVTSTR